ncbi:hypothetical protein PWT90_08644 [Aphanocladium album]|nr:hypothetical protein PWT90_08644 [Aphanocladium album]
MSSDKQGKSDQQVKSSQSKGEAPNATTSCTHTNQPNNTSNTADMPNNSGGSMAHGSLALRQPSSQYHGSSAARNNRHTSQADAADLFAVGAWADSQMGGAWPDDDFETHLQSGRSPSDKQNARR